MCSCQAMPRGCCNLISALGPSVSQGNMDGSSKGPGKQSEERASSLVTEGFSACPLSVRLSSCSARVPQRAHDVCRSEVCDSPCSAHAKPHVHEQHFLEPPSDPDQLVQSVCRDDCEVQPTASAFVVGAHDRVVPSLPHRIKSLRLRLAALQLRAASYFHGEDPRASDGSSMRGLAVLQEAPPGQGEGHLKKVMGPDKMEMPTCDSRRALRPKSNPTARPTSSVTPPASSTGNPMAAATTRTSSAYPKATIQNNDPGHGQGERGPLKDQLDNKEGELQEASEQIFCRLSELRGKLRAMEVATGSDECRGHRPAAGRGGRGQREGGAVKAPGGGQTGSSLMQSSSFGGSSGQNGMPEAHATRVQRLVSSALCIATSLLALTMNSLDVFEVGCGSRATILGMRPRDAMG